MSQNGRKWQEMASFVVVLHPQVFIDHVRIKQIINGCYE
jgi:hypothetical protein